MTENKVEEMYNRITKFNIVLMEGIVNPHKLAEILVKMEESAGLNRTTVGYEEPGKSIVDRDDMYSHHWKQGYVAALGAVRDRKDSLVLDNNAELRLLFLLDELKKKI